MTSVELAEDALSMLNDDCIDQILDWLSLDDLCMCSRTCKRLQSLCCDHFRRKFLNEATDEVAIELLSDGKLRYEKHVKYFYNSIKNLKISTGNSTEVSYSLVSFVKTKCDSSLNKTSIAGDMNLVTFCKDVEKFLKTVATVQFIIRTQSGQDEATFLKCCPNTTKLTLYDIGHEENMKAIFDQKYPKLQHFHCVYVNTKNLSTEKLGRFFRENKKIQCLVWKFLSFYQNEGHTLKCIQTAVESALNLKHFFLAIDQKLAEKFDEICNSLKVLCERGKFKSLELEFDDEDAAIHVLYVHAYQLSKFKQLTKIRLSAILFNVLPPISLLFHLKTIVLRTQNIGWDTDEWYDEDELRGVKQYEDKYPPQVDEIHIQDGRHILWFARRWPNLKRILLPQYDKFSEDVRISELNQAREHLKGACELTIFTDHDEANATNAEHKLVKLKYLEFPHGFEKSIFSKCCMRQSEH